MVGWEGGLVLDGEMNDSKFGLGAGVKVSYSRAWRLAFPLRAQFACKNDFCFYLQAAPLRTLGNWGLDAEFGFNFSFLGALYMGGYQAADGTSLLIGVRLSLIGLVGIMCFHPG